MASTTEHHLTGLCSDLTQLKCIKLAKARNIKKIAIFAFIVIIFFPIIVYCIVNIYNLCLLYYQNNKDIYDQRNAALASGDKSIMDPSNDDYDLATQEEVLTDQYHIITNNIRKSFNAYAKYNNKIKTYYKERNITTNPDVINEEILDKTYDSW